MVKEKHVNSNTHIHKYTENGGCQCLTGTFVINMTKDKHCLIHYLSECYILSDKIPNKQKK